MCDNCAHHKCFKRVSGVLWNEEAERSMLVYGNRLCVHCYETLKDDMLPYRPAPPCKPPAFIVAAQTHHTIAGIRAITLCICFGNWIKAKEIMCDAENGARFVVQQLKCKHYDHRQHVHFRPRTRFSKVEQRMSNFTLDKTKHRTQAGSDIHGIKTRYGRILCEKCCKYVALTRLGTIRKHMCEH